MIRRRITKLIEEIDIYLAKMVSILLNLFLYYREMMKN